ncbi:CotH kinase family protein [Evansella sp. LMS18]|uniref:CotH kinase family protein n=1 Tax=Evansella sp. LMS18 TaxID=2924033 RepID=UPI0020D0D4ED|nr:CotH kinase family protein [Evansella sp. LMS18]UTR11798.1 CotH kinase family protein [Evansella sp. LMS18]
MKLRNSRFILIIIIPLLLISWAAAYWAAPGPIINDENLEAAIREEINYERGEIRPNQLADIEELTIRDAGIVDLDGIEHLTSLVSLDLRDNFITDISLLSDLTDLRELNLRGNRIRNIDALANLTSLTDLNLRENEIMDISPLENMHMLEDLNLRHNQISDLEPLRNLRSLTERLYIEGNPVTDLTPVLDIADEIVETDFYPDTGFDQDTSSAPEVYPVFSHAGGFYDEEFNLEIQATVEDAAIYYTLDGSEPDPENNGENTYLYEEPITIGERSLNELSLSYIPSNNIEEGSRSWNEPVELIDQVTVVRAVMINHNESASNVATSTYFTDNLPSLPVISLSTNPGNFFGEEEGIYVPGVNYNSDGNAPDASGNYYERGREWERPVHIEYFETNGQLAFAQDAGVRIHGNFTRRFPQKSLRLYSRSDYGESRFSYPFFESKEMDDFNRLLLRNSGNDWGMTMFRDAAMQSLVHHLDLDTQHYQPAVVYLNGEYWGIHNIRDRHDKHYLETHYGADRDDFTILSANAELDDGSPDGQEDYISMLEYIEENGLEEEEHYEHIKTLMDVDNFIEYYVAQIYNANTDWPHNNISYWRYENSFNEESLPDKLDGRWRWFLFDVDRSLGYVEYDHNTIEMVTDRFNHVREEEEWPNFLFRELLKNDQFKQKFLTALADHMNTTFSPERVINVIDELAEGIEPEMENHINRWGIPESMNEWEENVEIMREFALNRPEAIREYTQEHFNLGGMATLTIYSNSERGTVKVNSIIIDEDTPGITDPNEWTGEYFTGVPVTLTAEPADGYEFAGWSGKLIESSDTRELLLNEDLAVEVIFDKLD